MTKRVAIIEGVRTPFCKAGTAFNNVAADDLGAYVVKEVINRSEIDPCIVDELVFGNVLQPAHATNIARILALKGGLPISCPAMTVNRNCSSGMDAAIVAYDRIESGRQNVIIAGGTESMSHFPVLFQKEMIEWMLAISKAKSLKDKVSILLQFRPRFLKPDMPQIADPLCGLLMGETAEKLSRDFHVTRQEQDEYALLSQTRTQKAISEGKYQNEITPVPLPPKYDRLQEIDIGPRENQTMADLEKLPPAFDRLIGTVTAGNSSQVTDGACALLLTSEEKANELGLKPLGYLTDYAYAALEPSRMGLGPVFAIAKLLNSSKKTLEDFDLLEINEAFAAQIVAVEKACASFTFAKKQLGRDTPLGEIDRDKLNVNGGAIALGHPVGTSGARLILTLIKELRRRKKHLGIATLCVGGGQGVGVIVEAAHE